MDDGLNGEIYYWLDRRGSSDGRFTAQAEFGTLDELGDDEDAFGPGVGHRRTPFAVEPRTGWISLARPLTPSDPQTFRLHVLADSRASILSAAARESTGAGVDSASEGMHAPSQRKIDTDRWIVRRQYHIPSLIFMTDKALCNAVFSFWLRLSVSERVDTISPKGHRLSIASVRPSGVYVYIQYRT